jgi:LPXTG-site transpeptidase (sortase) family protein
LAAAGWADDPVDLAVSTDSPRLVIPRIALHADVVEVRLVNGEWAVPRSVVGHLSETASPGQPGNAVFAGHVMAGGRDNVFTRLHELAPGDEISFLGGSEAERYQVSSTRLVRNTDTSVLASRTRDPVITLITCAGQWLPQENDYDQRLIVVATAV